LPENTAEKICVLEDRQGWVQILAQPSGTDMRPDRIPSCGTSRRRCRRRASWSDSESVSWEVWVIA
jgi:hypothetical protein